MDVITLFSLIATNPLSKRTINKLIEKDESGKARLERLLEDYANNGEISSEFKIIYRLIKLGLKVFGGDEKELRENLKNAYWRRGFVSVLQGITDFGIRKPFVPGAPFLVVWDFTYACNLHCKHCYSTAGKPWKDELSTQEALKTVDILADAGITALAFSGGEPLIRKDFFEVASYAAKQGMFVAVATNGTMITRDVAEKMKKCGVGYVQISLDGTKETHEKFRGIKGIYEKVVEGIINAKDAGLITCISTTATKINANDILAIMDLAEELEVEWFTLYNFIPVGRGSFEIDLKPEEKEELLKELWRRLKTKKKVNFVSTAPYYARVALQEESEIAPTHFYNPKLKGKSKRLAEFIGGCGCGRFYIAMRANGNIEPCVFFPLKLANIKDFGSGDDFLKFWRENKVLEDLRNKDKIEVCGKCKYRYVCGGCRARAYAYFKDYLAPDPGCIIAAKMIGR